MSRAPRDAYHAARLLQNELARLSSKRERQISKANGDFQLELIGAIAAAEPSTLKLVAQVLREDGAQVHLSRALETAIKASQPENDDGDAHERKTDPPPPVFELRRPAPAATFAPDVLPANGRVLTRAEHAGIGAGGGDDEPIDAEFDGPVIDAEFDDPGVDGPPTGYRYPDAGEPAMQLPDGTIVFDEAAALL